LRYNIQTNVQYIKGFVMNFLEAVREGKRRFRNLKIQDEDLADLDATDLQLSGCRFYKTSWRGATLEAMNAQNCQFIACDFSRAHLSEAKFMRTSFYELAGECNFSFADLSSSSFIEVDIRLANFDKAQLFGAKFEDVNATGANFAKAGFKRSVSITRSVFRMVDLRDADLRTCDLHKTTFEQADLRDALLTNCNLSECDFAGANVIQMQMTGADLRGANISSFDLQTMNFHGVKLYESQLRVLIENLGITIVEPPESFGRDSF
jgi:fluoroquinolone resistance protein